MKELFRKAAHAAGFEVKRRTPVSDPNLALIRNARRADCNLILDIGANQGQFASLMFERGWTGRIESYEPLSSAHAVLSRRAAGNPRWTVAPRAAIGAEAGTAEINISANSQSSSILPILERTRQSAPEAVYVGSESVQVRTLADILAGRDDKVVLKMDVQGFEKAVLDGAGEAMPQVRAIWAEMSLQPLYEGELLFYELSSFICGLGFKCVGLWGGHTDPRDGEMLQVDGLFLRV